MKRITIAIAAVIAITAPAVSQVQNQSGWTQGDGFSNNLHGQTRDGTSWWTQGDGAGGSSYHDNTGKSCWSQPNGFGGTYTSCNH